MTRYYLKDRHGDSTYMVREGGDCPYTLHFPSRHALQFDGPVPPTDNLDVQCAVCGHRFTLMDVVRPERLLKRMIEASVTDLPGRDEDFVVVSFKSSLSAEEQDELASVLPNIRLHISQMIVEAQLSAVSYVMPGPNESMTHLLFPRGMLFRVTSPTLNLMMMAK